MIGIVLNIPKELLEKIETHREDIEAAIKRVAEKESHKIKSGLWHDYQKALLESWRREYKPRHRITVVMDKRPYIGGGIITTLHAGRKRKR